MLLKKVTQQRDLAQRIWYTTLGYIELQLIYRFMYLSFYNEPKCLVKICSYVMYRYKLEWFHQKQRSDSFN